MPRFRFTVQVPFGRLPHCSSLVCPPGRSVAAILPHTGSAYGTASSYARRLRTPGLPIPSALARAAPSARSLDLALTPWLARRRVSLVINLDQVLHLPRLLASSYIPSVLPSSFLFLAFFRSPLPFRQLLFVLLTPFLYSSPFFIPRSLPALNVYRDFIFAIAQALSGPSPSRVASRSPTPTLSVSTVFSWPAQSTHSHLIH